MSVFITGATGFIAQYTIKFLIEKGYSVVGTVRSASKGQLLKSKFGNNFVYEIVPDIQHEGSFDDALKKHPEVTIFLHTASPVTYLVDDPEKELIIPAIRGTQNALNSAMKLAPQIKRFVYTSSFAAVFSVDTEFNPQHVIDEDSWNNITYEQAKTDGMYGYRGSKTFAERSAWDFMKNEKPNFELTVVNPTIVFGPQLFEEFLGPTLNHSNQFINSLIHAKDGEEYTRFSGSWIDVRDIAKAHIVAFESEQAKGKRLMVTNHRVNEQSILDILNENYPYLKGSIPTGAPGSDKDDFAKRSKIVNDRTMEILGYELISLKHSVMETAQQILDYDSSKSLE